jgi:hypothetical protein
MVRQEVDILRDIVPMGAVGTFARMTGTPDPQ